MKIIITITLLLIITISNAYCTNNTQFNQTQQQLILLDRSNIPMRVTQITNYQDSIILRTKSQDFIADSNDLVLRHLIDRMHATVLDSANQGVGIAAPQVGINKNIIWVQRFDKKGEPFEFYLNPKILKYSERKQTCREGCLSIPDLMDTLNIRSYIVLIQYDNFIKSGIIEMIEGFTAVIFQHEIDHINGKLFIDYIKKED